MTAAGSTKTQGPDVSRMPWKTLLAILLVYLLGAAGRSGNADVELMLAQSRAFLAGQVHLLPGAADGRGPEGVGGFHYSHFGIVCPLLWTPFLIVGRVLAAVIGRLPQNAWEEFVVSFSPAFVAAGTLALLARFWLDAGTSQKRTRVGLWIFGIASMLWPYSKIICSDLVMAFLILAGVLLAKRNTCVRGPMLAGLMWGLAFLTRKQLVTVLPALLAWIGWLAWDRSAGDARSERIKTVLLRTAITSGVFLVAVMFKLWWNHVRFGDWRSEPYPGSDGWVMPTASEYLSRVGGQLFNSGRGQIWFNAVVFAVALVSLKEWWRRGRDTLLLFLACSAGTIAFFALMTFWGGGISFGPRLQLLIVPLGALGWAYLPETLGAGRRLMIVSGAIVSLIAVTPGVFVDPVSIDKHHELLWNRRGSMIFAGWAEMRAVFGLGRPKLPEGLPSSAYLLETHPPFQHPDLWWVHAATMLRPKPPAKADQSQ